MALIEPNNQRPLVNFDYIDFAEGTGIIVLYAANSMADTTKSYLLTKSIVYSNNKSTKSGDYAGGAAANKLLDLDYDLAPFNLPKNMVGTAYISVPILAGQVGGTITETYIIAKLRHWDGTTETEIASSQSETVTEDVPNKILLVKITVPLTHFKKGETLRLTIEGWMKDAAGGNARNMWIGHDPKSRIDTDLFETIDMNITQLAAHIPFRLGV